ncbi:uncharacterized protein LOC106154682 [Lingula anatina]|uniref:Uncharacterized protein LOC106154682 n=1 Tax=Lingula anatina TaxID=7574 RepID=A0A2R2MSI0_LINAN|nr:uncharacterized protein LOC106154682 [Lingula anatina]|eukprot:XP_023933204.1 uncharacterized protein LOC106154682 [Lingula anatina]
MTEGLQKFQTEFISYMRRDNPSLLENSASPLTHAQQGHIEINDPHDADAPPVSDTSTESSTHGLAERISSNADFVPDPEQPVVSDPTVPAYRYGRQNSDPRGPHRQFREDVPTFTPTQRSQPVDTPLYTDENRQPPPTGRSFPIYNESHITCPQPPTRFQSYDGSTNFYSYYVKLCCVAESKGWGVKEIYEIMINSLEGKALDEFVKLPPNERMHLYSVVDTLMKCFGKTENSSLARTELAAIKQKENESYEEFGSRVRILALSAYRGTGLFNQMATESFLRGCSDKDLVGKVMCMRPRTLEEAVENARTCGANMQILGLRNENCNKQVRKVTFKEPQSPCTGHNEHQNPPNVSRVQFSPRSLSPNRTESFQSIDTEQRLQNIESSLLELIQLFRQSVNQTQKGNDAQFGTPPRGIPRCYNCHEMGHISTNCPQKNSDSLNRNRSPVRSNNRPQLQKDQI